MSKVSANFFALYVSEDSSNLSLVCDEQSTEIPPGSYLLELAPACVLRQEENTLAQYETTHTLTPTQPPSILVLDTPRFSKYELKEHVWTFLHNYDWLVYSFLGLLGASFMAGTIYFWRRCLQRLITTQPRQLPRNRRESRVAATQVELREIRPRPMRSRSMGRELVVASNIFPFS